MSEKRLVVKHNKLVEARYTLNLNEQKIILYAITKLDREQSKFNILKIDIREFAELLGTTKERYTEIREIVSKLMTKQVRITTEKRDLVANWISSIDYYKEAGKIELEFPSKLAPYLLQLQTQFTRYDIENILNLKNKYSIRVYELLKQYEKIGKRSFEIDELKEILGCEGKYEEFKDFKRYVVEVVKKELKKNTDIDFTYKNIKKGRKVTGLIFTINTKITQDKIYNDYLNKNYNIEEMKVKMGIKKENFNVKQVIDFYEVAVQKTQDLDIDVFEYVKLNYLNMIEKGTVRSKYGYLIKALEEDYAKAGAQLSVFNAFAQVAITSSS